MSATPVADRRPVQQVTVPARVAEYIRLDGPADLAARLRECWHYTDGSIGVPLTPGIAEALAEQATALAELAAPHARGDIYATADLNAARALLRRLDHTPERTP